MNTVTIRHKTIGDGLPMMIIAEVASAHEGNFDELIRLIDLAILAGADAVKFQVFNAESHMTPAHRIYELAKKLTLTPQQWLDAIAYTRKKSDILILADIYDEASVETVHSLNVDMLKIHSADLNNYFLIERIARLNKPTLIGIGASTVDEIAGGIRCFRAANASSFLGLLHGYQAFPTKVEELNIAQIKTLKDMFGLPVGFLDHTEGETDESLYIPLVARSVGAFAVEKHIVVDRSKKGVDHESALSLEAFKKLVRMIRQAEASLGSPEPLPLTDSEKEYRRFMKKCIVARTDIRQGETITQDKIIFKRSSTDFATDRLQDVLGKKAKSDITKDQNIDQGVLIRE